MCLGVDVTQYGTLEVCLPEDLSPGSYALRFECTVIASRIQWSSYSTIISVHQPLSLLQTPRGIEPYAWDVRELLAEVAKDTPITTNDMPSVDDLFHIDEMMDVSGMGAAEMISAVSLGELMDMSGMSSGEPCEEGDILLSMVIRPDTESKENSPLRDSNDVCLHDMHGAMATPEQKKHSMHRKTPRRGGGTFIENAIDRF